MKIDPEMREELKRFFQITIERAKQKTIIISANNLDDEDKAILLSSLPKIAQNELKIDYQIDPSLFAGVMIKTGSKILDLSLKGKLQNIKKTLYGSI